MTNYFDAVHDKWMSLASKLPRLVWIAAAVVAMLLASASQRDGTRIEWLGAALMFWSMACVWPLKWAQSRVPRNSTGMSLRLASTSASVGLSFTIIGFIMLVADIATTLIR